MKKRALDWLIAFGIVLVLGFPFIGLGVALDKFGMGSPEAAGWAQAFGTIAAIVGMFYVGRFQAEKARLNTLEMDEKNLARKHSALCAILDDAYEQCARLKVTVGDLDEVFHELTFILVFDERSFGDAIENVEKISLHELDSYDVVRSISKFRNCLISIRGHVLYAMDPNRDRDDSPDYAVKKHVADLIVDAETEYILAVNALGGNPLKEISPFTY